MATALRAPSDTRRDDVFFLILVDFLVQILFFGLFLFVFYQASLQRDQDKLKEAVDAAGVSDVSELTDDLSRLAPVKLKEFADLIKRAGGVDAVAQLLRRVSQEGGATASISRLDKLRRLEGSDKPSCLVDQTTRQPRALMAVQASGRSITITQGTPDLARVVADLGVEASVGHVYSPETFQRAFSPLLSRQPQCRFYIRFEERTELVAPRRAAGSIFYLMVR